MKKEITILIVDDHPIFRKGLRSMIELEQDMRVVGEAADGEIAIEFMAHHAVDVIILDLDMPKMNGLEFAQLVKKNKIPAEIIILTMHKEEQLFKRAMDLGIHGFINKENAVAEIAEGIRSIAKGNYYVCSIFSNFLIQIGMTLPTLSKKVRGFELLSPAERTVLKFIAENMSSKQIAERLSISPKTVENHRTKICTKLQIHGSYALMNFVMENKSLL